MQVGVRDAFRRTRIVGLSSMINENKSKAHVLTEWRHEHEEGRLGLGMPMSKSSCWYGCAWWEMGSRDHAKTVCLTTAWVDTTFGLTAYVVGICGDDNTCVLGDVTTLVCGRSVHVQG